MTASILETSQPARIGPYRIKRLLGSGGMGKVFLALREDDFEQRVALKVVGQDPGNEEILSRFYNERQILANLEHPGIARLLDGGATEDGQPYFVMEYVEGERIDRYCEENELSIRECLELFCKVCEAVQFAHQNLVVHRDLKAGNILVTGDGDPRLLDFGIAKVLRPGGLAHPVATLPGQTPMTPAYASPEQVLNQPITTACDVYALGVLLYRLMAGSSPYRLDGMTYAEIVEVICYREPEKPSAAVGQEREEWVDERTTVMPDQPVEVEMEPSTWSPGGVRQRQRRLAGDLDAIVLKAMRKDPHDRYGSAAELAEDLRRHLTGLPVRARQGTWLYLGRKFIWRYKALLAVMLLILGFSLSTTILWRTAVEERAQAVRERTRAQRITKFLESLFNEANPDEAAGEDLRVRDLLARGRDRVATELEEDAEIAAEILGTLGNVYNNLGHFEEAAEVKAEVLRIRRQNDPSDRSELAKSINNLARLLYDLGEYEGAEELFREAIAMRQRLGEKNGELATNLLNLASTLSRRGHYDEAEDLHREALEMYRHLYGNESSEVATSLYSLGTLHFNRGEYDTAEPFLRQALELRSNLFGARHTLVAQVLNSLGRMLHARGDLDQALKFYEEALSIRHELLGGEHVGVAYTRKNLAALRLDRGEIDEAGMLIKQALEVFRASLPEGNLAIVDAERVLGAYLLARGRYQEAERYLLASYQQLEEVRGAAAPSTLNAQGSLVALYDAWGRPAMAARYRALGQKNRMDEQEKR